MTNRVGTPEEIAGLKTPLIEAAIDAYLAQEVNGPEFFYLGGNCAAGGFEFKHAHETETFGLLESGTFLLSYPGGIWQYISDDSSPQSPQPPIDGAAIFSNIEMGLAAWIDPWVQGVPDLAQLAVKRDALLELSRQLYVGAQPVATDADASVQPRV